MARRWQERLLCLCAILMAVLQSAVCQEIRVMLAPERRLIAASKDVGFECGHNIRKSDVLVYWQKDGEDLTSSRVEKNSDGILIIKNVQTQDSGVYTCAVRQSSTGKVGWAHAVLTVVSNENRLQLRPQVTVLPGGRYKVIQSSFQSVVDMHCLATGHPMPYLNWFRESGKALPRGRHTVNTGHLVITNFQTDDVDVYVCRATNFLGQSEDRRYVVGRLQGWGTWSAWEMCSQSCGPGGVTKRQRKCMLPSLLQKSEDNARLKQFRQFICPGSDVESSSCNPGRCPPPPTTAPPTQAATRPPVVLTTTPPGAAALGSESHHQYIGCFNDLFPIRVMPYAMRTFDFDGMTPSTCIRHCQRYHYSHAGVENGNECWCGGIHYRGGRSNKCTIPCLGNNGIACGGKNALSVYSVSQEVAEACQATLWGAYDRPALGCGWELQKRERGLRRPELECKTLPRLRQERFVKVSPCPGTPEHIELQRSGRASCAMVRSQRLQFVTYGQCRSVERIQPNYCMGRCDSPLHQCTYKKVSNRNMLFQCQNGIKSMFRVALVTGCQCRGL